MYALISQISYLDFEPIQATPGEVNRELPPDDLAVPSLDLLPKYLVQSTDELITHLDKSVMVRVCNIPHRLYVSILYCLANSQIDCSVGVRVGKLG